MLEYSNQNSLKRNIALRTIKDATRRGGEITQLVSETWNLPHSQQNSRCHSGFGQEPDELQEAIVLISNVEHIQDYLIRMVVGAERTTTGRLHSESKWI
jgi:hypothetical protein